MISQIESDKTNPSYKVLRGIAEKLETPLEYFLSDIQSQLEEKSYLNLGKYKEAIGHLEQALYLSDQKRKPYSALHALPFDAVYYWRTALQRFRELTTPDPFIQSQILTNLARIHQDMGEVQEAERHLRKDRKSRESQSMPAQNGGDFESESERAGNFAVVSEKI
ncbi:MAG: tetratricopeptide repeat protein [Halobacteriota archaeon]